MCFSYIVDLHVVKMVDAEGIEPSTCRLRDVLSNLANHIFFNHFSTIIRCSVPISVPLISVVLVDCVNENGGIGMLVGSHRLHSGVPHRLRDGEHIARCCEHVCPEGVARRVGDDAGIYGGSGPGRLESLGDRG